MLQHEIDACISAANQLSSAHQPWDALTGWIERFTDFVGTKRGLAAALHSGDPAYDGPFYRERSPIEVLDNVTVPTFLVGGEFDLFQRGTPLVFERLQQRAAGFA